MSRAYRASSGMASRRWSSARKLIEYASMDGSSRAAIAVTRLESRPPLRNDATGTSDTRWARTDEATTSPRSTGGPEAASAAARAGSQYTPVTRDPSGRYSTHVPGGRRCTCRTEQ